MLFPLYVESVPMVGCEMCMWVSCWFIGKGKKKKALAGFEPAISCLLDRRFNQLSHRATSARNSADCIYYFINDIVLCSLHSGLRRQRHPPLLALVNFWNILLQYKGSTQLQDARRPYLTPSEQIIQGWNRHKYIERYCYCYLLFFTLTELTTPVPSHTNTAIQYT